MEGTSWLQPAEVLLSHSNDHDISYWKLTHSNTNIEPEYLKKDSPIRLKMQSLLAMSQFTYLL